MPICPGEVVQDGDFDAVWGKDSELGQQTYRQDIVFSSDRALDDGNIGAIPTGHGGIWPLHGSEFLFDTLYCVSIYDSTSYSRLREAGRKSR